MSDTKNDEKPMLSEREGQLLVHYILTAEGGLPKADWDKFAAKAGFKNGKSARVSFARLKEKIMAMRDESGAPAEPTTKSTPKKPSSAKRKALPFTPMKSADVDDDEMDESPTKKVKVTPKKSATKKEEPET